MVVTESTCTQPFYCTSFKSIMCGGGQGSGNLRRGGGAGRVEEVGEQGGSVFPKVAQWVKNRKKMQPKIKNIA